MQLSLRQPYVGNEDLLNTVELQAEISSFDQHSLFDRGSLLQGFYSIVSGLSNYGSFENIKDTISSNNNPL